MNSAGPGVIMSGRKQNDRKYGFTIVELLIVVVVIAILAAITVGAYNGMQARARDSQRKQDLANLARGISLYSVDKGDYAVAGCGSAGSGTGWLSSDYDGAGPLLSINACLINSGHMRAPIKDPSGLDNCSGATCHAYMKSSCGSGTFIMANLETLPQNATATDAACTTTYDTDYGINYVVRVGP